MAAWRGAAQAHVGIWSLPRSRGRPASAKNSSGKAEAGRQLSKVALHQVSEPMGCSGIPTTPEAVHATSGPLCPHLPNGHSQCPCLVRVFLCLRL